MGPPTRQSAASRKDLSLNQLGNQLADLTINPRTKVHADRVVKSTSSRRKDPSKARRARSCPWKPTTRFINLTPAEAECAQTIFETLHTTPRWSNWSTWTPQLLLCSNGSYELEYPRHRRWTLQELRGMLRAGEIHSIGTILQKFIRKLHDAHIAYIPDMETVTLGRVGGGAAYLPFIDTFDFSKRVDDPTVRWTDFTEQRIGIVKAQFQVLTRLAELRDSSPSFPTDVSSLPDTVVDVLALFRPSYPRRHAILREVTQYTHKLGRYIARVMANQVYRHPMRTGPADENTRREARDGYFTLLHAFRIMAKHMKDGQVELEGLRVRASLWVVRVAVLIHLHAREVNVVHGTGIVDLYRNAPADSYTSHEGFRSVADAYAEMNDATRQLQNEGAKPFSCCLWFFT
ncbi:hypothetical protein F4802DRAFT_579336 [Xylaria palmicola]|nr:hypothetical protein F4802DRAFT_579336 [Xylaria palmicola]